MPTVTFATHCHAPHLERLHSPGVLLDILKSHAYPVNEIFVTHQNCRGIEYRPFDVPGVRILETEDYYPQIFAEFGIKWPDSVMDELTHGKGAAHFWEAHCQNHLIELKEATSAYIVFSDCDCKMIHQPEGQSWIEVGLHALKTRPDIFCVSPSDGGGERLTQTMSQQLFLVDAARMRRGPLGLSWNGKFDAPGGPMAEFYGMLEGRITRLMIAKNLYRYVLPERFRYWHHGNWRATGWER